MDAAGRRRSWLETPSTTARYSGPRRGQVLSARNSAAIASAVLQMMDKPLELDEACSGERTTRPSKEYSWKQVCSDYETCPSRTNSRLNPHRNRPPATNSRQVVAHTEVRPSTRGSEQPYEVLMVVGGTLSRKLSRLSFRVDVFPALPGLRRTGCLTFGGGDRRNQCGLEAVRAERGHVVVADQVASQLKEVDRGVHRRPRKMSAFVKRDHLR